MLWLDEWKAWTARLTALNEIMRLYTEGRALAENHGATNQTVLPELRELYKLLVEFQKQFGRQLPTNAARALETFLFKMSHQKIFDEGSGVIGLAGALYMSGLLGTVKSQVDYFLADKQARARRIVDRAFTHLQRSLVADIGFRMKWLRAYREVRAEEACEKLGAVHMLLHGIWAFKADAKGGKTDLIFGQPLAEDDAVRAAEAMVLTEWKLVRKGDVPADRAKEAREQAERYAGETLAGFELSSHRYLVLVSEDFLIPAPTVTSPAGIQYEVRNIAVRPSRPSVMAAAAAKAL